MIDAAQLNHYAETVSEWANHVEAVHARQLQVIGAAAHDPYSVNPEIISGQNALDVVLSQRYMEVYDASPGDILFANPERITAFVAVSVGLAQELQRRRAGSEAKPLPKKMVKRTLGRIADGEYTPRAERRAIRRAATENGLPITAQGWLLNSILLGIEASAHARMETLSARYDAHTKRTDAS